MLHLEWGARWVWLYRLGIYLFCVLITRDQTNYFLFIYLLRTYYNIATTNYPCYNVDKLVPPLEPRLQEYSRICTDIVFISSQGWMFSCRIILWHRSSFSMNSNENFRKWTTLMITSKRQVTVRPIRKKTL